jgi:protein transport protein SEC24
MPQTPVAHGGTQKRRHYAANQAQAYYGEGAAYPDAAAVGGAGAAGYGAAPGAGGLGVGAQQAQLFTPGFAGESQFAAQQAQTSHAGHPAQGYYGQDADYGAAAAAAGAPGAGAPAYGQTHANPPYVGQQAPQAAGGVDQLSNQFGQMGIGGGGGYGQKSVSSPVKIEI